MGERAKWTCHACDQPGECELCESCLEHCAVRKPNDVDEHRRFDVTLASTDPRRAPN